MRLPGFAHKVPERPACTLCAGVGTLTATDIFAAPAGLPLD
jgi:hypothetical protein